MESTECAICYETTDNPSLCLTSCGHLFCNSCLNQWFDKGSASCPICREKITTYKHNDETIRIVHKIIRTRPTNGGNVRLIRLNQKLTFSISIVCLVKGAGFIYMGYLVWDQYKQIQDVTKSYQSCENRFKSLISVQIIWDMYTKTCKIPQYVMKSCFN